MASATEELPFQCFILICLNVNSSVGGGFCAGQRSARPRAAVRSLCDLAQTPPALGFTQQGLLCGPVSPRSRSLPHNPGKGGPAAGDGRVSAPGTVSGTQ